MNTLAKNLISSIKSMAITMAMGILMMIREGFFNREVIAAEDVPKADPICSFSVLEVGKQAVLATV